MISAKFHTRNAMSQNSIDFPNITYRRGASGLLTPVLRGTGIRVQTIVIASENMTAREIANDYDLTAEQVLETLKFYEANRAEIDAHIQAEIALEQTGE